MALELEEKDKKTEIGPSLTAVHTAKNRLIKDSSPIQALTEYIGDYVYYELLMNDMGDGTNADYMKALSPLVSQQQNHLNLQIAPSTYTVKKKLLSEEECDLSELTPKEIKKGPVQNLLEYSRPLLDTKPVNAAFKNHFTVRHIEELAAIAWMDALLMNNDRFVLNPDDDNQLAFNINNLMIYDNDGRKVIVPIDQSFCRALTGAWYKWIHSVKTDYKQVIFAESWLDVKGKGRQHKYKAANAKNPSADQWLKWYEKWVLKPDTKKFVVRAGSVIPRASTKKEHEQVIAKTVHIVDILWKYKGREWCANIESFLSKVFQQIDNNNPDIAGILKKKGFIERGFVIDDTVAQWKIIKKYVEQQFKSCAKIPKPNDSTLKSEYQHIKKAIDLNTKFGEFEMSASKAKQLEFFNNYQDEYQYNHDQYNHDQLMYTNHGLLNFITLEVLIVFMLMLIAFISGCVVGIFTFIAIKMKKNTVNDDENPC